jgi:hypothetical protein
MIPAIKREQIIGVALVLVAFWLIQALIADRPMVFSAHSETVAPR